MGIRNAPEKPFFHISHRKAHENTAPQFKITTMVLLICTNWGVRGQSEDLTTRCSNCMKAAPNCIKELSMPASKLTLSHGSPPVFVSLDSITPNVPAASSSSCRLRAWEREGGSRRGGTAQGQLCPPGPSSAPRAQLCPPGPATEPPRPRGHECPQALPKPSGNLYEPGGF